MAKRVISDDNEIKCSGEAKRFKSSQPEQGSSGEEERSNSICLRAFNHIRSYLNYDQVAQLEQVCMGFRVSGKWALTDGYNMIIDKLERELERAEESGPVPSLHRCPSRRYHFLKDIYDAFRSGAHAYHFFLDPYYDFHFVAGKVLDEARHLLEKYNSHTMIPFSEGKFRLQGPHPLLDPFIQLTRKACKHFEIVVAPTYLDPPYYMLDNLHKYWNSKREQKRKTADMQKKVKEQERRIWIGEQTNRLFRDTIRELSTRVMQLSREIQEMDQKLVQLANWGSNGSTGRSYSFVDSNVASSHSTSQLIKPKDMYRASSSIFDDKRPKLGTLPSNCLQRILSHLSYGKVSQLRRVSKHFDETCKKVLNEGLEKIKAEVEFRYDAISNDFTLSPTLKFKHMHMYKNLYLDLKILIMYCEDTYKCYLDEEFYFSAGKVLDILCRILNAQEDFHLDHFVADYYERPHIYLFPLFNRIHKAVRHFRDIFAPQYGRRKCSSKHVPSFLISGDMSWIKGSSKKQQLLKMEMIMSEQEEKMEKVNEKNRKLINIISKLKKRVELVEREVLEKRQCSNECVQHCWNLFRAKFDRNNNYCTLRYAQ